MTCTACNEGTCEETFICKTCGRGLSVCDMAAGGQHGPKEECADCWEARCLPAGWDAELPKKLRAKKESLS